MTMAISKLKPIDFQGLLAAHGHDLGQFGVDGLWGSKTASACEAWFGLGNDLVLPDVEPPHIGSDILPPAWLPDCDMDRIVIHWTAGSYAVSAVDREHYHFIVGGDNNVVRGDNSVKANVSASDADGYAAHTKGCNTKSIGVAAACMANAVESPFRPGTYPLTIGQLFVVAKVTAECCRKYKIKVTSTTVLQHGEVQKNLGIAQNGKWDINKLPWAPSVTPAEVAKLFRELVSERL